MYIALSQYYNQKEHGFEGSYEAYIVDTNAENLKNFLNTEVGDNGSIYNIIKKEVDKILVIKNLNIDEDFQGQGYGSELLYELLENAKSYGAHDAVLLCDLNESQKSGFSLTQFYENHDFSILCQPHDCPLMFYPESTAIKIKEKIDLLTTDIIQERLDMPKKDMLKEDIIHWLRQYNINNYVINDDLTVDVKGDVYLDSKNLSTIPINFGTIDGSFMCQGNLLTSLKGCPHTVTASFNCNNNKLTSLEHGPKNVTFGYGCANNLLTSLKGCAKKLKDFNCNGNQLISLEYGPESIEEYFHCNNNFLQSLTGCPQNNLTFLDCSNNKLKDLNGAPPLLFSLCCNNNNITSLDCNIVKIESKLLCHNNPIISFKNCTILIEGKFFHSFLEKDKMLIEEVGDLYTYDNVTNKYSLELSGNQFNAFTQSQRLDKILPHKKEIISKKKI